MNWAISDIFSLGTSYISEIFLSIDTCSLFQDVLVLSTLILIYLELRGEYGSEILSNFFDVKYYRNDLSFGVFLFK
ncbi:hypothetical protein LCGC14_1228960 [marine sediment metagenome]|uniref:Uncharacterized protein n=1 Tax=marine sediment metagenome TaxID=412755 RepID=A0A0F9LD52_9ZZZZ